MTSQSRSEKRVGHVRADEAGATGDSDALAADLLALGFCHRAKVPHQTYGNGV